MKNFIALLIACSCALAFGAKPAEQANQAEAKALSQKPKNAPKQQFIPKQQQLKTPNTHVQKLQTPRTLTPRVTKKQLQTPTQQHLQTNTQQLQKNKLSKETVEKIRAQHVNFHAKPNTSI